MIDGWCLMVEDWRLTIDDDDDDDDDDDPGGGGGGGD